MSSIDAVREALTAAVDTVVALDFDALDPPERFAVLDWMETQQRRLRAVSYAGVSRLERFEGCPKLPIALADVLRISPTEARRRFKDAEQLAPRTTLTGEVLPPVLPETAKAWQGGQLDGGHLEVIEKFFRALPDHVPPVEAQMAETCLAGHAVDLRPDQLEKVATQLSLVLNPDGMFSDKDRALQRGFTWGRRRADGMREGKLVADPELQAEMEPWFAKFAAPGMGNPDDENPTVAGEPTEEVAARDSRSHAQRQHDALRALVRGRLGDPRL